nr:reverse transcriptase domain-containing protein [Tanacetum cinerariifolium]GFB02353.1 reverse transcriptase domain-containing protein [Tanacetum cinerariifolium]
MVEMIRGMRYRKRSYEKIEQWMHNEISFPSVPRCQLVDSPIVLEVYIEGFQVRRIYVDGGSSSEVMYEHCFRNLGPDIRAKLRESRVPLVGFLDEERRRIEEAQGPAPEGRITHPQIPASEPNKVSRKERTQTHVEEPLKEKHQEEAKPSPPMENNITFKVGSEGQEVPAKACEEGRPPEQVLINDDHPDQPITIGGSLSAECR